MKGGVCVSTVSIVCGHDGGLPHRPRADQIGAMGVVAEVIGRLRRRSIVADAAEGADGILEPRMHSDDPAASAALTTEGDVDAQRPQEGLRAPEAAGERAGIFGPAGAADSN